MTFKAYYARERQHLFELGPEFAKQHPRLGAFLAHPSQDPDIERLLEGFAFLTAKLWQKMDDEFPELTYDLLYRLAPETLMVQPSGSIFQFGIDHLPTRFGHLIPAGQSLSIRKNNEHYTFKTLYETTIFPLTLSAVHSEQHNTHCTLSLSFELNPGVFLEQLELKSLRFFLSGPLPEAYWLYYALLSLITEAHLASENYSHTLSASHFRPAGFTQNERCLSLLNTPQTPERLLCEFFSFPEKFLFVDLVKLDFLKSWKGTRKFKLSLNFELPASQKLSLSTKDLTLYCTPVLNIGASSANPIVRGGATLDHPIDLDKPPLKHLICQLQKITGWPEGSRTQRNYSPIFSAYMTPVKDPPEKTHAPEEPKCQVHIRANLLTGLPQWWISFFEDPPLSKREVISLEVLTCQTDMPETFPALTLTEQLDSGGFFGNYKNLTGFSWPVLPPLSGPLHWRLINTLTIAHHGYTDIGQLQALLQTYEFASPPRLRSLGTASQLANALQNFNTSAEARFSKSGLIRGKISHLTVQESAFLNHGEIFLLGQLLQHILEQRCELNSYHRLVIIGQETGVILPLSPCDEH